MGPDPTERVAVVVVVFALLLLVLVVVVTVSEYARRRDRAVDRAERAADREFFGGLADRVVIAIGAESRARVKAERDRLFP